MSNSDNSYNVKHSYKQTKQIHRLFVMTKKKRIGFILTTMEKQRMRETFVLLDVLLCFLVSACHLLSKMTFLFCLTDIVPRLA